MSWSDFEEQWLVYVFYEHLKMEWAGGIPKVHSNHCTCLILVEYPSFALRFVVISGISEAFLIFTYYVFEDFKFYWLVLWSTIWC